MNQMVTLNEVGSLEKTVDVRERETMINDDQTLNGATSRFGNPIKVWDDGFGPLWIHRESLGVRGIVRAHTREDAWECVFDEILMPIPEGDVAEAFNENGELHEGYHFQSNSTDTGIVCEDLNGNALDRLTSEFLKKLEITLDITDD